MCSANLQTYSANFLTNGDMTTASIGTVLGTSVSLVPIADAVIVTTKFTATGCASTLTIPSPNCNCPMVAAPVSLGNMTVCMGQTIPSLSAQVNTDEVIDWYDAATGGTLLLSSSATFTPTAAGTYYAVARKTASNCSSARTPITVSINPTPVLVGRDTSVCENTTFNLGTLVNNYNQTLNHKWYLSTLASAPIAENTTITSTATYFLMADNSFGCADTTQLTITVLVAPTLTCSKTDATTTGGTDGMASVAVSGGVPAYQYRWSNGNLTSNISALPAGTYAVTVTDANTCSSVCTSVVAEPVSTCNLLTSGLRLIIDQKSTAITTDDEYVVFANPTGTGLATTYNVGGDINFSSVAYGSLTEIGRVPYSVGSISYVIEDGADQYCSIADAAFGLNANTCLLQANISVVCSDAGTANDPSDDTFSISLNPSGNGIGVTYNVTGDITASNVAYGSAQTIATGLLISGGARTISVVDATTANCELLNINITPPLTCSTGVICAPKCAPIKVTKN
jgi:hypothetical protein